MLLSIMEEFLLLHSVTFLLKPDFSRNSIAQAFQRKTPNGNAVRRLSRLRKAALFRAAQRSFSAA